MKEIQQYLKIATDAALAGGEILRKYWGNLTNIEEKGYAWDLVTNADKESEEAVLSFLKKATPEFSILSEEAGLHAKNQDHPMWIVDPLDGTTNYTHQYPMVAVTIALAIENKPVVGVTYNPILKELFQGGKGLGVTLNGETIHVSKVNEIERSLLVTGFPYDRKVTRDNNYKEFCHLTHLSQGVRRGGSASVDLAYIAAGRLDGYWERGLKPWDIAAGIILVEEAGGQASSYDLRPYNLDSGKILATNGLIHKALSNEIQAAKKMTFLE